MNANANSGEGTLWRPFELAFEGPSDGNPFQDVRLRAVFRTGDREVAPDGFYDGDGTYRVRFLPDAEGVWSWTTESNTPALDGIAGKLVVGPALPGDHGPVRVSDTYHFRHADGTRFINIGTTAYAWNHQEAALQEETLETLAAAPFTKIRMCVLPKHYRYNETEPEHYPFPLLKRGSSHWPADISQSGWQFDFSRFDPAFFRHLESRIAALGAIGIEADLILLHAYDRWGFSVMPAEVDDRYLRYVVARLAAFPNVWWSMANEYDFMAAKSAADWDRFIGIVSSSDPYGHLLSVHNGFAFYDYADPRITHASIQRSDTGMAPVWRHRYGKPVSIDECCYEGDIAEVWGNITAEKMVHRFWTGIVNGGYVTHGETYGNATDTIWWAKGGRLIGDSVARIAFLRRLLEEGPDEGLDPIPSSGHYRILLAGGFDEVTLQELIAPMPGEEDWPRVWLHFATAGQPHRYYLTYFGEHRPSEFVVPVPPGESYRASLIDTWAMSETSLSDAVSRGSVLTFAAKPHQAVLLRRNA